MNKKFVAGGIGVIMALGLSIMTYTSTEVFSPDISDNLNTPKIALSVPEQVIDYHNDSDDTVYVRASEIFPKRSDFNQEGSELHSWNYSERMRIDNSNMTASEKRLAHQQRRIERARRGWEVWNQGNAEPAMNVYKALSTLRFVDAEFTGTLEAPHSEELQLIKLVTNYSEDTQQYQEAMSEATIRCHDYLSLARSEEMTILAEECLSWTNQL